MKIKVILLIGLLFFSGTGTVYAGLGYGNGAYVNLCGSGTVATQYTCDGGCNPYSGSCQSQSRGAVRYVCNGKWDQCLETESSWSNLVSLGDPGCGNTVQLSLFDKQCRKEDGTWDQTCGLLGYMVWYSGDCDLKNITPFPTGSAINNRISPTRMAATPTLKPTILPTATLVPTIRIVAAGICGNSCAMDSNCQAGTTCQSGVCRNPACPTDKTCFCGTVKAASSSAVTKTPETGGEMIWLVLGIVGVGILGLKMRRMARKIW